MLVKLGEAEEVVASIKSSDSVNIPSSQPPMLVINTLPARKS